MADFINTIDVLGDDAVLTSILDKSITEFKDDQLKKISTNKFFKCKSLTTVDIPNVTYLGSSVFESCESLKYVNAPNLTNIGSYAFRYCKSLVSINAPKLTSIGQHAIECCDALVEINFPLLTKVDGIMYCPLLTKVCFPNATEITTNGLRGNENLAVVDTSVLEGINYYSMCGCKLEALILRNTATVAGLYSKTAFEYMNQKTDISRGTGYIYVPAALVDQYKVAENWSTYANQFRALEDYTVDGTTTGELDKSKI